MFEIHSVQESRFLTNEKMAQMRAIYSPSNCMFSSAMTPISLVILSFFFVPRAYYFAVQYYGECYGAPKGTAYDRHGKASNCWSGVGGANSNYVYRLF